MVSAFSTSRVRKDFDLGSLIIGFLIFPILMVPKLIRESKNNYIPAQIMFCIFLGLLSVLSWPPRADTYRHALVFYRIQSMSLDEVFAKYFRGGDFVLLICDYIFGRLGFSFEFLRLIIMAIAYGLALKLYNLTCLYKSIRIQNKWILFWMFILMVPFYDIVYAIRYGFAMMFICYFIIKRYFIEDKSIWDFLFLILGFIIHFGTAWIIVICLMAPLIPNRCHKAIYISIFVCAIVVSVYSTQIIQLFAQHIYDDRMVTAYTSEDFAQRFIFHGFWGTTLEYSRNAPLYLFIILGLTILPYNKNTKIFMCIIILWAFTYNLWELNRRIGYPIYILGPIYSVYLYKLRKTLLTILFACSFLVATIIWRQYTVSNILYVFAPLPVSIIQNYDYHWLKTNVSSEGTLLIQKH